MSFSFVFTSDEILSPRSPNLLKLSLPNPTIFILVLSFLLFLGIIEWVQASSSPCFISRLFPLIKIHCSYPELLSSLFIFSSSSKLSEFPPLAPSTRTNFKVLVQVTYLCAFASLLTPLRSSFKSILTKGKLVYKNDFRFGPFKAETSQDVKSCGWMSFSMAHAEIHQRPQFLAVATNSGSLTVNSLFLNFKQDWGKMRTTLKI